ncbi:MAG: wax ester/triacylglycerol synthase family O-acyltransferase [bacterium]|nr:wax ester/triacylglycerol synthase family O-acyltransferase [bacterium]
MTAALRSGVALSKVDAAWLRMEHPTNLMTITAVMSFAEPLNFARLKSLIEDRLLPHDRFRQRVVESTLPFVSPRWIDDDTFNLNSHLIRVALPDPGDKRELQDMVSSLMSTPLDYSKPLWQFQYIENYRGGSAVVARIHHCIADGIALVRLLLGMTEDSPKYDPAARARTKRPAYGGGFWLPEVVNEALYSVRRATGKIVDSGLTAVTNPEQTRAMLQSGTAAVGVMGRLLGMSADPPNAFRGDLGTYKKCAWSEVIPFDAVKGRCKDLGVTINDLLLSSVTGALRRYLVGQGSSTDGLDLRAVVPVNLRPDEDIGKLGNRFGLVFLSLPVGIEDSGRRLAELKRRMDALKNSSEAIITYAALNAVGGASAEIESQIVNLLGSKATAVMTNVPGPREEIFFAGSPMRSMMFWVPQSARLGLGVSLLSYAGQVRLGVATDAGLVRYPDAIVQEFETEMMSILKE